MSDVLAKIAVVLGILTVVIGFIVAGSPLGLRWAALTLFVGMVISAALFFTSVYLDFKKGALSRPTA